MKVKTECNECHKGKYECDCTGGMGYEYANEDCSGCCGTGYHTCPSCDGRGWMIYEEK